MLSALAPARRRLLIGLVVLVGLVLAGVVLLVLPRPGNRQTVGQLRQDRPGPVLMVPGYGGSGSSLDGLAAALRRQGKDVTILQLPGNGTGDLRQQARVLGRAAQGARARTGAPSVDVVGYSAGGVVARYWLEELGGAALTRRLVTVGSPHHGTELAELGTLVAGGCPAACQQLQPDSPLLTELDRLAAREPSGPRVVSIWTTFDDVVVPPDSARLAGALNLTVQGVCSASRVDHSALPSDPVVQAMVSAQLGPGPTGQVGPQDCRRSLP
ncbi:MAG: lipase family alpha/beta hydrolase [Oryzihumus sp.]